MNQEFKQCIENRKMRSSHNLELKQLLSQQTSSYKK
jgi:hypothetical protein